MNRATTVQARRDLRDASPEQLEAMQHVARECSDVERALGRPHTLTADEAMERRMQCLRASERPFPHWLHAVVWLSILAGVVALAALPTLWRT